jgi:chromosome partitioning protein
MGTMALNQIKLTANSPEEIFGQLGADQVPMNKDPYIIAVSSQKGGVAKTTTSVSLGASLAECGVNVLLVDLDPQAHLTQALSMQSTKIRRTIGEVLINQATLLSVTRESEVANLDVAPANEGLLLIDKLLYNTNGYEYRLKNVLRSIQANYYEYIILDCPPSVGPMTLNALTAANLVVLPTSCDIFAANSLQGYLHFIDLVKRRSNSDLHCKILITLFDARTKISRLLLEKYRTVYRDILFDTVISMDVHLRESALFGKPITVYAKNTRSAEEYRALTRELLLCAKTIH